MDKYFIQIYIFNLITIIELVNSCITNIDLY